MKHITDIFWTFVAVWAVAILLFAWPVKAETVKPATSFEMIIGTAVTSNEKLPGPAGAFGVNLRITCTADCQVSFGDELVTATSAPTFLPADWPTYFVVPTSDYVFGNSYASGTMYVEILQ